MMKINEIKQLSRKEFAERYPFVQVRYWNRDKLAYELATYDEDCEECEIKKGDPVLEFYTEGFWHGWCDLLLCWAEKVREVFLNNGGGKIPNDVWISDLKEKYGYLRIYFGGSFKEPYEKINEYNYMLEHLSLYVCHHCGHIGRVNEKKLVTYRSKGHWIEYQCRDCAKKESWEAIKDYGIKDSYFRKWLWSNPHYNLYKSIFNDDFEREEGDWFVKVRSYEKGKESTRKIDCHELFEGMF